ncbi:hypothetical protein [Mycobacterium lepromatosis]|uniref:hypothetical protein n=1 Tax=Mycobacterium lepromatosis TaxID=480418 RepID=UPI000ABF614E|nr:hypothetical protein [Mycobacterium lepromatosis]
MALIARGIILESRVTTMHATAAPLMVLAGMGRGCKWLPFDLLSDVLVASSGMVLDVADIVRSTVRGSAT